MTRRIAAVTIAIIAAPPHGVLFVERAAHLRDHPGQIALPGGSADPADGGDLERTALRELREEVGVAPERVTILARLPLVRQTRANNFDVTPFVATVAPGGFTIDGTETAGMFTIPLEVIVGDALRAGTVEIAERVDRDLPARLRRQAGVGPDRATSCARSSSAGPTRRAHCARGSRRRSWRSARAESAACRAQAVQQFGHGVGGVDHQVGLRDQRAELGVGLEIERALERDLCLAQRR